MSRKRRRPPLILPEASVQQAAPVADPDELAPGRAVAPVLCPYCAMGDCRITGHLLPRRDAQGKWTMPIRYGLRCSCETCAGRWTLVLVQVVEQPARILLCEHDQNPDGSFNVLDAGALEASRRAALSSRAARATILVPH